MSERTWHLHRLQQVIPEVHHREVEIIVHMHRWSVVELLVVAEIVGGVERFQGASIDFAEIRWFSNKWNTIILLIIRLEYMFV